MAQAAGNFNMRDLTGDFNDHVYFHDYGFTSHGDPTAGVGGFKPKWVVLGVRPDRPPWRNGRMTMNND